MQFCLPAAIRKDIGVIIILMGLFCNGQRKLSFNFPVELCFGTMGRQARHSILQFVKEK